MSRYDRGGGGSRDSGSDCKLYVGDLSRDASEKELERAFSYYGLLKSVWVARNPPGFAFVVFEDSRDAEDAVRGTDGTTICGSRVRVEQSTGKVRPKPWMRRGGGGGGRDRDGPRGARAFNPDDRCYECGEHGHYAYDCRRNRGGGGSRGGGGRNRRSRSRSRSRSYDRRRDYSRSRSRSRTPRKRSRSPSRDKRSRSRD